MASKKILIITDSRYREKAKELKQELEKRKVCDIADIYTASTKKLLEDLIVGRGKEQYNYRMFIIDSVVDAPSFPISKELYEHYSGTHLILWTGPERPKTALELGRWGLGYHYKVGMTIQQVIEAYKKFHGYSDEKFREVVETTKSRDAGSGYVDYFLRRELYELEKAINAQRYSYQYNYIIRNPKGKTHYPTAARKVRHIMTTGIFDARLKVYPSKKNERKVKSKKALDYIMSARSWSVTGRKYLPPHAPDFHHFESLYLNGRFGGGYGKDITEPEHAAEVVKRLRQYQKEAESELADIQKTIREWEDRFPGVAENPDSAGFSIAAEDKERKKNHDD